MNIGYTVDRHGCVCPVVSIPGKDSVPLEIFLADIRLCQNSILASIDSVLVEEVERFDWSGDQAFATITPDNAILEAQWIRDAAGTERGESLPTRQLRELIVKWKEIVQSVS